MASDGPSRLGSVHNVLGASGTILATLVYDGFGNITTESDASKTGRYTWTGRERDVEIDLQVAFRQPAGSGAGIGPRISVEIPLLRSQKE